ncbi:MAG: hypothetical protein AAGA48_36010 [Myxococcota bacterium]
MSIHLLIVDPQHDFCDPKGSLSVPGADEDMARLAGWVRRYGPTIEAVTVTLDSHRPLDIAHPTWFTDGEGRAPDPFTQIDGEDFRTGRWSTRDAAARARTLRYLDALAVRGRYAHTIWPEHCLLGTLGHTVAPELNAALQDFSRSRPTVVEYVIKGLDPFTEHFSAIAAEVPDPLAPSTLRNQPLLDRLAQADHLVVAGEASSHCVANTVRDIVAMIDDARRPAMTLLTDAMSPVPGFENYAEAFLSDMAAAGVAHRTTEWTPSA